MSEGNTGSETMTEPGRYKDKKKESRNRDRGRMKNRKRLIETESGAGTEVKLGQRGETQRQ